jgi:hypothetical protein
MISATEVGLSVLHVIAVGILFYALTGHALT